MVFGVQVDDVDCGVCVQVDGVDCVVFVSKLMVLTVWCLCSGGWC